MTINKKISVLIVCMGNICRSPTAEVVLRTKAMERGIMLEVDSAGTIDFHSGEAPDPRTRLAGEKRGYCFDGVFARKVNMDDFSYYDYILAADTDNLNWLKRQCPAMYQFKLALFMSYCPQAACEAIPDPYYGDEAAFESVLDRLEMASTAFLEFLSEKSEAQP